MMEMAVMKMITLSSHCWFKVGLDSSTAIYIIFCCLALQLLYILCLTQLLIFPMILAIYGKKISSCIL